MSANHALRSDSGHTQRCNVNALGARRDYTDLNQARYTCDADRGSSGSPVLRGDTNRVMALHHVSTTSPCDNYGTMMGFICAEACDLVTCTDS